MQLLPLVSLTAGLRCVVIYNLGSLHKGTTGFVFVYGVFFYLFAYDDLFPLTEGAPDLFFALLLHFLYLRFF